MTQLSSHIYWMDVGEVGYLDFKKRLKQKAVARQITAFNGGLLTDLSLSKAQKMIAKAIEAQEKADKAAKRSRIAKVTAQQRAVKGGSRSPRSCALKARPFQSRYGGRTSSPRSRSNGRRNFTSSYSSRSRGSNRRS